MSNSLAPELTPLQPMLEPESLLSFPRIATKNNLLKLNWWHSPTEPLEIEAVFLASPGRTDTNCEVPPPIKSTMDNNNKAVCSSTSEKSTPQSHQKNSEDGPMVLSPGNCTMLDLDEDLDLKDSQLLVKGNYNMLSTYMDIVFIKTYCGNVFSFGYLKIVKIYPQFRGCQAAYLIFNNHSKPNRKNRFFFQA